jgi:hypothetical protein
MRCSFRADRIVHFVVAPQASLTPCVVQEIRMGETPEQLLPAE